MAIIPQEEPWRAQLDELIELAFKHGLSRAIEKARSLNDPFLLDKFHDTIVNELRLSLIEKEHNK